MSEGVSPQQHNNRRTLPIRLFGRAPRHWRTSSVSFSSSAECLSSEAHERGMLKGCFGGSRWLCFLRCGTCKGSEQRWGSAAPAPAPAHTPAKVALVHTVVQTFLYAASVVKSLAASISTRPPHLKCIKVRVGLHGFSCLFLRIPDVHTDLQRSC